MADRTVRVLRAFNGIAKDGKSRMYFTPENERLAEEYLSGEEFQYRQDNGFISVEERREVQATPFKAPQQAADQDGSRQRQPVGQVSVEAGESAAPRVRKGNVNLQREQ